MKGDDHIAEHTIAHCDMSSHPQAAKLVGVGDDLRDAVLALGCEHRGYVGTLHRSYGPKVESAWGFVVDVVRCPDETVVGAMYTTGNGDGFALKTLLDNGTVVSTETSHVRPLLHRLWNVWGHHPRDHFFVVSLRATPSELYASHVERVRRIARREHANPIKGDPLSMYMAMRIRSSDLLEVSRATFARLGAPLLGTVFVIATFAITILAVCVAQTRTPPSSWAAVVLLTVAAGLVIATLALPPLMSLVERRLPRSPPSSPASLFERAARVGDVGAPVLVDVLHDRLPFSSKGHEP
jgi:hypothetical protein